jgi:hypothetical protein
LFERYFDYLATSSLRATKFLKTYIRLIGLPFVRHLLIGDEEVADFQQVGDRPHQDEAVNDDLK